MSTNDITEELGANGLASGVEEEFIEKISEPFDPASISIEPKVITLDTVIRRLRQGSIQLAPDFQREYVWDNERSSLLIESLLLRIPLPMFYVAANEDGSWDVVDGLQRLTTIRNFILGGELNENGSPSIQDSKEFKLNKLEFLGKRFNGQTYTEILKKPENTKAINNIMETELRFTIINPGTPEEVKRNIFKRINTGGMPLTTQEIRNALYQGESSKLLAKLVRSNEFMSATSHSINDSRMVARELILRFLAFRIQKSDNNSADMDKYLSDTMRLINCSPDLSNERLKKVFRSDLSPEFTKFDLKILENGFKSAMNRCHAFFGEYAFRKAVPGSRRTPVNKALFDTWSNIFYEISNDQFNNLMKNKDLFFQRYSSLLQDQNFGRSIGKGSYLLSSYQTRYKAILKLIDEVA